MIKTKNNPSIQEFHLKGVKHILPEDAWEAIKKDEAEIIDVREVGETSHHVEKALLWPVNEIPCRMPDISKNRQLIIMCRKGIRSTYVVRFLGENGFTNAVNLDGGFEAWCGKGLPFKTRSAD